MASVPVLPLANYANGSHTSSIVDIADDVTSVDFNIQRCTTATPTIWPNASTVLTIIPEVSVDGGPFIENGRSVASGGIGFDKHGNEAAFTLAGGALPVGINRRYRATAAITGGPLRSTATIEVN